jgi:hypothetical protein
MTAEITWAAAPGAEPIRLHELLRSPAVQIRRGLDDGTVQRYVSAFRAGTPMPPLKVAEVGGELTLIDGFHRLRALEVLGAVEAHCVKLGTATLREARWLAAESNLPHGLPLRNAEVREAFVAFVKAGRHRKEGGGLRSYREIGAAIGRPPSTVFRWMHRHFPRVAAQMADDGMGDFSGAGGGRSARASLPSESPTGDILGWLHGVRLALATSEDPEVRWEVLTKAKAVVAAMEAAGNVREPDF